MTMHRSLPVLLCAALACVQEPSIPKIGDQPIELKVSASLLQVRRGDVDTIRVTATNHLTSQVRLVFPTTCQIRVYIRDVRGRVMVPENGEHACVPVNSQITFPASGTVVREFVWRGGSQFVPPGSTATLPAGVYYVTAEMAADIYGTIAFAVRITLID